MIIIPKKHHRGKQNISDPHEPHFSRIFYKGIDVSHDELGIGRQQVFGEQIVNLGIDIVEDRQVGKDRKENDQKGDDKKEGAPAHAGRIKPQPFIEEIFEKIPDEHIIGTEELLHHRAFGGFWINRADPFSRG